MATWSSVAQLKDQLGITDTTSDDMLAQKLDAAHEQLVLIGNPALLPGPDEPVPANLREAELIYAARLYTRKDSPEGIAGWGELGVIRIRDDPDVRRLMGPYIDIPVG
jgi:Phage gp6-like head-tail connector protein